VRVARGHEPDARPAREPRQTEREQPVVAQAGALDLDPGVRRAEDVAQRAERLPRATLVPAQQGGRHTPRMAAG